jgi:alkylmercury lyase
MKPMTKLDLYAISEGLRVSGIDLPSFGADVPRFTVELWRLLINGRPISPEQLAKTLSSLGITRAVLTQLKAGLEYDDHGNIVGAVGLSLNPTSSNRLQINSHTLYTWCAWDALFIPLFLTQTVMVDALTPTTEDHIRIQLTPEHVEHYEPERAVVSIIVPTTRAVSKASTTEDIWLAFCSHVHFFSSREAASAWFVGKHYEPLLLSIEEGYELGRLRFAETLKDAEGGP